MSFRTGDGPDERAERYERTVVRPRLERKRQQLVTRIRTLTGDELIAAERELANVEAELKGWV